MRLYLSLSKNSSTVPFDHLPALVGALHKWIGKENKIHGETALYSFSWLQGAKPKEGGLNFPSGSEWFISVYDVVLLKSILQGIQKDPTINYGLAVTEIMIKPDPEFNSEKLFSVASPVLVKKRIDEKVKHFVFTEKESDKLLTETLKTKLQKAGLNTSGVEVLFDRNYNAAKTKKVNYKGIGNLSNICPVIVKGTPEQIAFAWNVGIGNSTGIGFGALN
jgi:CRISPR-associated endoribonuclease Cas6